MKVIFIGPTLLTKSCMEAAADHCTIQVLFTLDKKMGQKKCRYTPFDDQAKKFGFDIYEVKKINMPENIARIQSLKPDLIIEAGWSEIISKEVIDIPLKGTIGIHGAVLPDYPGQASMNWALINGEKKWGVTLMYLDQQADAGDIIAVREFDVTLTDDIKDVHKKSDIVSAELMKEFLPLIEQGKVPRIPQDVSKRKGRTGRRKLEDALINWNSSTRSIYNWIRAQTEPFPGAFTSFRGRRLHVWKADYEESDCHQFDPGQVTDIEGQGFRVKTQNNTIFVRELSYDGGERMSATEFSNFVNLKKGDQFG